MLMGNVGAKLRPTQVVDINGRRGTFCHAGATRAARMRSGNRGEVSKGRFFSLISFGALLAVPLVAVFRRNAVRPAMLGAKFLALRGP